MKTKIETLSKLVLAILLIVFGLNKFMGFIVVEPPSDPLAQAYMGAMFTTYLYIVVGITEIIGGILLLVKKTSFLGFLLLLPVMVNIVLFHLAHDMPGNGIWLLPTLLFLFTGFSMKDKFNRLVA